MFPAAILNGKTLELCPPTLTAKPSAQVALIAELSQNVIRLSPRGTWGFVIAPHSAMLLASELDSVWPQALTLPLMPRFVPQTVTAAPLLLDPSQPVFGPQVKSENRSTG